MITAVAVFLRMFDIIFDFHNFNVVLRQNSVTYKIYIFNIRTDNSYTRDVVNVIARRTNRQIQIFLL